MQCNELNKGIFILVLVVVTLAFFDMLSPYFSSILWSAILAIIFYPVKNKLYFSLREKNKISSLLTIGIICLIVFIPLTIIASSLAKELNIIYTKLQHNNTCFSKGITSLFMFLPEWARSFLIEYDLYHITQIRKKLSEIALKSGRYLAGSAFLIGKGTFSFTISFGVMLYLLFFFLKDGTYLVLQILDYLPLSNFIKQHLLDKLIEVTRAIAKGTVLVAIFQGTIGGIIFYIISIDGSVLLGLIVTFLSLVPTVGSAMIWLPIAVYLFATKQIWKGFFIFCFFIIITIIADNILRPLLVSKDIKIPDYLILVATFGGVKRYGINGFIIGPLITALFISCWNLLSNRNYTDEENRNKNPPFKEEKNISPDIRN